MNTGLCLAGSAAMLEPPFCKLMTKLCSSLSDQWGLSPKGFKIVGTFTTLTYLDLSAPIGLDRCRVPDCLTQLCKLKVLVLAHFSNSSAALSSLPSLSKLYLAPSSISELDITSYSGLTYLRTATEYAAYHTMLLPIGKDVCLQHLSL